MIGSVFTNINPQALSEEARSGNLCCLLQVSGYADAPAAKDEAPPIEPSRMGRSSKQPLTRERRVALRLCNQLSLYWRRENLHDKSESIKQQRLGALLC